MGVCREKYDEDILNITEGSAGGFLAPRFSHGGTNRSGVLFRRSRRGGRCAGLGDRKYLERQNGASRGRVRIQQTIGGQIICRGVDECG